MCPKSNLLAYDFSSVATPVLHLRTSTMWEIGTPKQPCANSQTETLT